MRKSPSPRVLRLRPLEANEGEGRATHARFPSSEALKAALADLPEVSIVPDKSISIAIDVDAAAESAGSSGAVVDGRRRGQTVYLIAVAIVSAGMFALLTAAAMHWLAR